MPEAIAASPPTAKPSAPPAPALKPTPAPKPPEKSEQITPPPETDFDDGMGDDAAELSELDGKPPKAKADAKVAKPDRADAKPDTNGHAKPGDQKPKEDEPKTNPELRAAYDAKKKLVEEYEPQIKELQTLRARVKEIESRDESTTKATQDEIAAIKKRNAELEHHMRFVDYKQSKEYKEKESELNDAWSGAMRKLGGISISRTDAATGDVAERELTVDDLARYARLDPKLIWKELKQEIPDAAERTTVINHVQKIQDLSDSVFKAEEKARAESETHAKTQTETQRQFAARREKAWKETNAALAEKYPKWFGKDEADPEGNAVFDKGASFADLVFSPADLTQDRIQLLPKLFKEAIESSKPFSPEMLVKLHAIARNKLANHDRAISKLKTANARIAELETSLKQYEESGPDKIPTGGRRGMASEEISDEDELRALDRR